MDRYAIIAARAIIVKMEKDKDKEEVFACKICYKMARKAVECTQEKCRKLFCFACVQEVERIADKEQQMTKCPYCRNSPFSYSASPSREKINNLKTKCSHCQAPLKFSQVQAHEQACEFRLTKCKICSKYVKRKDLVGHTTSSHSSKTVEIVKYYHESNTPIPNPQEVIKRFVLPVPNYGKVPHLGTTGKFYCGDKLGLLCSCCNGSCGPTNGQNCLRCMRLDLIRFGLPKGHLLNGKGSICWKNAQGAFCCGLLSSELKTCGYSEYQCKFCRNTTINQQRYRDLLQK